MTGVRQDAWAKKNRIKVEVDKDERERGYYLHAEAFGQPQEKGISVVNYREAMGRISEKSGARRR